VEVRQYSQKELACKCVCGRYQSIGLNVPTSMAGCIVRCFLPSFSILAVFPSSQIFASQLEHPKYSSPITLHAMVRYAVDTASQTE
jgi:hypothetical protein